MVNAAVADMIDIQSFSYSFGDEDVLQDVSISIREGEFISILGQNGAGKSTLLKCILRILKGGRGQIKIAGKHLESYSQRDLARVTSYVPQADGRGSPFRVSEFVMMGRYPFLGPFSAPGEADHKAVQDALTITGIREFAGRYLSTLSGGECQKVFIAAALAQEARVLLLDEPTTFLDPKHAAEVSGLISDANRDRGVTVLAVTHDINQAVLTSDRILALREGRVCFLDAAAELVNDEILRQVYDRSFSFFEHPLDGRTLVAPDIP